MKDLTSQTNVNFKNQSVWRVEKVFNNFDLIDDETVT